MNAFQAILLGLLQGLTEFLPVSSSGHIELGKALFGVNPENELAFTVLLHLATVLSTLVVFRKDIFRLAGGLFASGHVSEKKYVGLLLLSMLPVMVVGLLWKDEVEQFFGGHIVFVGAMLLVTAALLWSTRFARDTGRPINGFRALVIGLAQAVAVLPGISRSGATISTALLLKTGRKEAARFSFLMVLLPVIGASLLEVKDLGLTGIRESDMSLIPLLAGFLAAFLSGWAACRWMIRLVQKGRIGWFALYCALIGLIAIFSQWIR